MDGGEAPSFYPRQLPWSQPESMHGTNDLFGHGLTGARSKQSLRIKALAGRQPLRRAPVQYDYSIAIRELALIGPVGGHDMQRCGLVRGDWHICARDVRGDHGLWSVDEWRRRCKGDERLLGGGGRRRDEQNTADQTWNAHRLWSLQLGNALPGQLQVLTLLEFFEEPFVVRKRFRRSGLLIGGGILHPQ